MKIFRSISSLQKELNKLRKKDTSIGFVPTMGALHEGHLSLVRKSKKENKITVLSIFVNPTQFGPKEDYAIYPRQKNKDEMFAKKANVDIIFYPSKESMYPAKYKTYVDVTHLDSVLCGKNRPEHFRGVATVVLKLLHIVNPDYIYLGQKDAQQAIIIRKMITDLNMPVKVKTCPIIREKDGLALSSRNQYLTKKEREEAPILFTILNSVKRNIKKGQKTEFIKKFISKTIRQKSHSTIEYVECMDAETLTPQTTFRGKILVALAVKFGKTRLIDNIIVNVK